MKTCTRCKQEKNYSEFYKNATRKDGHTSECKACSDLANKKCRANNRKKYNGYRGDYRRKLTDRVNDWKRQLGCAFCSETEPCCLELHHNDPSVKENHPSWLKTSWERFMKEAEKCTVVCSNCHKKIHAGIISNHVPHEGTHEDC